LNNSFSSDREKIEGGKIFNGSFLKKANKFYFRWRIRSWFGNRSSYFNDRVYYLNGYIYPLCQENERLVVCVLLCMVCFYINSVYFIIVGIRIFWMENFTKFYNNFQWMVRALCTTVWI